jgi:hypothetical protein
MPLLDNSARFVTNRLPKVINPTAHAVIDYAMAASFLAMGAFFWKRNKRAAVSSLICGGAEIVTSVCTDYPGGVVREISFETHGAIDFGLSGMIASMPDMLRFSDERETTFFRLQGLAMATVSGLTDFTGTGKRSQLEKLDERAA